jgi:6-phosphogluconolactonase/glucosamine-6-phosphate isomerase/deaminase
VNTKGFSEEQKAALLDLLILGMYQDGHIASNEHDRVKLMADSFELGSDYAREQFVDASFARVTKHQRTPEAARSAVFEYASRFGDEKQRQQALQSLAELLASDNRLTNEENRFLLMVEEALQLKKSR